MRADVGRRGACGRHALPAGATNMPSTTASASIFAATCCSSFRVSPVATAVLLIPTQVQVLFVLENPKKHRAADMFQVGGGDTHGSGNGHRGRDACVAVLLTSAFSGGRARAIQARKQPWMRAVPLCGLIAGAWSHPRRVLSGGRRGLALKCACAPAPDIQADCSSANTWLD